MQRQFQIKPNRRSRNKHPLELRRTLGAGSLHRRYTSKGPADDHLEPFQRMCDGNHILMQQVSQVFIRDRTVGRMINFELGSEPAQPILLPLARQAIDPAILKNLFLQAFEDRCCCCLKTPPIVLGTQSVDAVTINTAITFKPDPTGESVKISRRIAVAPDSFPAATGAHVRPRPWVTFPQ